MSEARCILIAAGGTGGHLFPASALATALAHRGAAIELATDDRALKYGGDFPARAIHAIPSATTTGAGALNKARAALVLGGGLASALLLIGRLQAARGRRLRRLSHRAAADGGLAAGRRRACCTSRTR